MSHLDLDFREKTCNISTFLAISFIILVSLVGVYSNIKIKRQLKSLKNETRAVFESAFVPKGLIKKNDTAFALILVNGTYHLIKPVDTVIVNYIPIKVTINDSILTLKSKHFKRSITW